MRCWRRNRPSYRHRLRYQTFDVTDLVVEGVNVVGATLADGWYRGRLGFGGGRAAQYGDRLGLIAQLEIVTTDGGVHRVVTDEAWKSWRGPTTRTSIYDGEDHDPRPRACRAGRRRASTTRGGHRSR